LLASLRASNKAFEGSEDEDEDEEDFEDEEEKQDFQKGSLRKVKISSKSMSRKQKKSLRA
jgi:hypothetical protein